jgi:hypothetical protein
MVMTLHHLRRPLFALVAFLAALSTVGEASACTKMRPAFGSCATICGCCSTESSVPTDSSPEAVLRPATERSAPMSCGSNSGCVCRSERPPASQPRPVRDTSESRPELSQDTVFAVPGDRHAARVPSLLPVSAAPAPSKTPLYLRNERLLF